MNGSVVTKVEDIFEQGNLHMSTKLRHFGGQGQQVVKYIMSKLRKYKGVFFESNSTIAENVGCSIRTVQNTIKRCEQLEIFIVSSRKESTLNGKMRQTTNKIQLLTYKIVEVVKEVVEEVRKVVKVVKEVVRHVSQNVSSVSKNVASSKSYYNNAKAYSKKTIRKEICPNWLKMEYEKPIETVYIQAERDRLMKELEVFKR
ncbi:helix-turn-helix domain-containing protein [Bacillus sp. AFS017336]|uniref:helix-turn-helix domain-containing protein n=1 Tax=Bacillus sp. AFS017336 TaxID=2033489 RepID=UPI00211D1F8D|nr:helix-turn-helix domain-containing protein [Bacillus sp. AFS017336]